MTLNEALSIYFSQAESSREGWRDADDETWDKAEAIMNKQRRNIFIALKQQELLKERINIIKQKQNDPTSTTQYEIFDFEIYVSGKPVFGDDEVYLLQSLVDESEK